METSSFCNVPISKAEIATLEAKIIELEVTLNAAQKQVDSWTDIIQVSRVRVASTEAEIKDMEATSEAEAMQGQAVLRKTVKCLKNLGTTPTEEEKVYEFIENGQLAPDNIGVGVAIPHLKFSLTNMQAKIDERFLDVDCGDVQKHWEQRARDEWHTNAVVGLAPMLGFSVRFDKNAASMEEVEMYEIKRGVVKGLLDGTRKKMLEEEETMGRRKTLK